MSTQQHVPVLLDEALEAMNIRPDGTYIDCTYGRGGHGQAFLSQLSPQGKLFVLDQDLTAVTHAREKFSADKRVKIFHQSFEYLQALGVNENVCGKGFVNRFVHFFGGLDFENLKIRVACRTDTILA